MSRSRQRKRRPQISRGTDVTAEVTAVRTVTLRGHEFTMADRIGSMAFMHLAYLGEQGADSGDMAALAALYRVCRSVFTEESWERYRVLADELRLGDEAILADVQELVEVVAGRPTSRWSASPAGRPTTRRPSPNGQASHQVVAGEVVEPAPDEVAEVTWALDQYAPGPKFPNGRPDLAAGVAMRWDALHPDRPLRSVSTG